MVEKTLAEVLAEEHHVILKVIGVAAVLVQDLEKGVNVDVAHVRGVEDFMTVYGDRCHHGKEEAHLFPALLKRGVPERGCPIGQLIHDHMAIRAQGAVLRAAADAYEKQVPTARDSLLAAFRDMIALYPNHVWREDYLLYPMIVKILTPEDQAQLIERFRKIEEDLGWTVHEHAEILARDVEKAVRGV